MEQQQVKKENQDTQEHEDDVSKRQTKLKRILVAQKELKRINRDIASLKQDQENGVLTTTTEPSIRFKPGKHIPRTEEWLQKCEKSRQERIRELEEVSLKAAEQKLQDIKNDKACEIIQ